jgi:L-fucose mutarotase
MLRQRLLHPEILAELAAAGHGSQVLISDGNFAHATGPSRAARHVYLNLAPDLLRVTDILEVVLTAIPVESATLMVPDEPADAPEPAAHAALIATLPDGLPLSRVGRMAFYELTRSGDLALVIASGDTQFYANVLLTVGAIRPS